MPDLVGLLESFPQADLRDFLPAASEQNQGLKENVRQVWRECRTQRDGYPEDYDQEPYVAIYCNDFRRELGLERYPEKIREKKLKELAEVLLGIASIPVGHFENLNKQLSEHLFCIFKTDTPEAVVLNRAYQLLSRLPETALKVDLHDLGTRLSQTIWPEEYFIASPDGAIASKHARTSSQAPWEDLEVVSLMSKTTIIVALQLITAPRGAKNVAFELHRWVNFISELLDQVAALSTSNDHQNEVGRHILLAHLWTEWQRSMMLLMYHILGAELMSGNDESWTNILALRGNSVVSRASCAATLDAWSNPMSKYICPWAFELLKASRSSLGFDFRVFHKRFSGTHGYQPARCLFGSGTPCDGNHPLACGRLIDKSLVAAEQSMHKSTCSGNCGLVL